MEPITFAVVVAVIVGITEVIKMSGLIPKRFMGLVALVVGVAGVAVWQGGLSSDGAIYGLIGGLSASGLWSNVKSTIFG